MSDASNTLRCAGGTDPGLRRHNNEDRIHCDVEHGLFIVVDGVGGQAAGEKAAEIALAAIRSGVDQGTGPTEDRLRAAIVAANNEIYREAQLGSELAGMSCVVTAAVVADGVATIGHVGDTRLYKCRDGAAVKVTHDHSPVGEQEESGELSEADAMRHPMRNQVYRALGGAERSASDQEFVDIHRVPFEPDSALLLCSDGLTDLVPLRQITSLIDMHAGDPRAVVERLIDAANCAGGKDNVSAIFVEGEGFAANAPSDPDTTITRRIGRNHQKMPAEQETAPHAARPTMMAGLLGRPPLIFLSGALVGATVGALLVRMVPRDVAPPAQLAIRQSRTITVGQESTAVSKTIGEALALAEPGDTVVVDPGEYREQVRLVKDVTLTSLAPRKAVIVPAIGSMEPTVIIDVPRVARLVGFEIRPSADMPLPVGILLRHGSAEIADVEISGTRDAAIEITNSGESTVRGSHFRANRGAAILIHSGATPRITHNLITRDDPGATESKAIEIQGDAKPVLAGNLMTGFGPNSVIGVQEPEREQMLKGNLLTGETTAKTPPQAGANVKPKGRS